MEYNSFCSQVVDSFCNFVADSPPRVLSPGRYRCLADYIQAWLESGEGVKVCKGDFSTFLIAVTVIVDYWVKVPELTDYTPQTADGAPGPEAAVKRRVSAVLLVAWRGNSLPSIFDRHFFEACIRRVR